jgi:hypothetical protein
VKRVLYNKVSFTLAAVAIFLVGMLRDPDTANADDLDAGPVAQERMPGYHAVPDGAASRPLSAAEIAALNLPSNETAPTF